MFLIEKLLLSKMVKSFCNVYCFRIIVLGAWFFSVIFAPELQAAQGEGVLPVLSDAVYNQAGFYRYSPLLILGVIAVVLFLWQNGRKLVAKDKQREVELQERQAELEASNRYLEGITSRLMTVYDAVPSGVLIFDVEGNPQEANRRFFSLLSIDDGHVEVEPLYQDLAQKYPELLALHENPNAVNQTEIELEGKYLEIISAPILNEGELFGGSVWVVRDVTREKSLQAKLVQSQKMEAVGTLAGGVAHDFNNLLCGVLGNIDFARAMMSEGRDIDPYLHSAEKAARRGSDLVKKLLSFSRRSSLQTEVANVNEAIHEVLELARPSLPQSVRVESHLAADLWCAQIDLTHFEQVLLNLCVNARDAMAENGGVLTISSENVSVSDPSGGPEIDTIEVLVSDTGPGIPAEHLPNIFDPFYTTKAPGEGTGLGLSTAVGIISQMGGKITCQTEVGVGTEFRIILPALPAAQVSVKEFKNEFETLSLEGKKILVVDDDEIVRKVAAEILIEYGARISTASNGEEALQKIQEAATQSRRPYDLLLMDWSMPVMNAQEVLGELGKFVEADQQAGSQARGEFVLPVMLMTGQALDAGMVKAAKAYQSGASFIEKPFDVKRLTQSLVELLEEHEVIGSNASKVTKESVNELASRA